MEKELQTEENCQERNSDIYIRQLESGQRKIERSKNFELDYHEHLEQREHKNIMAFLESDRLGSILKELRKHA